MNYTQIEHRLFQNSFYSTWQGRLSAVFVFVTISIFSSCATSSRFAPQETWNSVIYKKSPFAKTESADDYYNFLRADIAYNDGDYKEALKYYKRVGASSNYSKAVVFRIVELSIRSGQLQSALSAINRLPKTILDDPSISLIKGLVLIGLNNYEEALATLEKTTIAANSSKNPSTPPRDITNVPATPGSTTNSPSSPTELSKQTPDELQALNLPLNASDIDMLKGVLALKLGSSDRALKYLQSEPSGTPPSYLNLYYLALALEQSGKKDLARETLKKAIDSRPVPAGVYIDFMRISLSLEKRDDALEIIDKILRTNYEEPAIQKHIQTESFKTAKFTELPAPSQEQLKNEIVNSLLTSSPQPIELSDTLTMLAATKIEERNFDVAEKILHIAIASSNNNSKARYLLATCYIGLQELGEAAESLLLITPDQENFADSRILASFLFQARGETDKSIAALEELLEEQGDNARILAMLASIYQQSGDNKKAVKTLEKAKKLTPNDDKLYFSLATLYDNLGDKEKTEQLLIKAIALNPANSHALNYLAYNYAERGVNLDLALELIQKAISIEPQNGYYLDTLAWTHYRKGSLPEAESAIEAALVITPNDPIVLEHLGIIKKSLGKLDDALTAFKKALENITDDLEDKALPDRVKKAIEELSTVPEQRP